MTMTTTPRNSDKWLPKRVLSASTMHPHHHEALAVTEVLPRHPHPSTTVAAQHRHTDLAATASSIDKLTTRARGNEELDTNIDARASTRSRWARLSIRI